MIKETAIDALITWLTKDTSAVIQLMLVLIPVLTLLLAALVVYAVFWKGGPK